MTLFALIAGVLLLAVTAALIVPLMLARKGTSTVASSIDLSLAVLKDQLAELGHDRENGIVDEANYSAAKEELERRALEDATQTLPPPTTTRQRPFIAVTLGLLIPVAVIALYVVLGSPEAFRESKGGEGGSHALTSQQIVAMVERLAERLQENPNDGEGWLMLARSYAVLGKFPEAVAAYGRATTLLPPNAQTLADYADTVAMAQGRSLQGAPEKIVQKALEVDPRNVKALALAGTIAFEKQNYNSAIAQWRKILEVVPEGSSVANSIEGSIRDAENRMAMGASQSPGAMEMTKQEVKPILAQSVSGSVSIDSSLKGQVKLDDVVFIFARAANGPKMPLAILRKKVADLPLEFTLDDSMAMTSNNRLSAYPQVVIGARVSRSGDATPKPGDLEGLSMPVAPGAKGVKFAISTVRQ
ncbi:c-type cytochrome biogenesis protein CcmI [Denitratisoma oestradiolicum]|uniref:C-type cytochrome biogenesis protein CcmI n=1 Tax=Denitratisoma oestradiolicum TaxID=311182 RepID=A0A6S6YIX4_9PROT|nr:c-type cytochrome biogenesis protein CcmI [Denitratisoma oestradiolicum]TWO80606.1 c-type cytochrome biogenesis protein CcmI [Denitratisoma oestradiolicum]CAB1367684.1 C-type cytochrome biogenesis protein CcmI [Denitratisoma oestradiolicum]